MPISFHTFTSKHTRSVGLNARVVRGPQINSFIAITRDNQDLLGLFVWTAIFERFPKLRVVSVEADAGWVPHYINRMDHSYNRHRFWKKGLTLQRMPSEYFLENVYLTFQDDRIAFVLRNELNIRRLLWANDFPHSDSTWPDSQELLAKHTADLTHQERRWVLRDNVADLYDLHHVPA
jgi:predicted TIM-barrel fold metal-dependent hydrolase